MFYLLQLTVIILALIAQDHEIIAQNYPYGFTSIVIPITKHTNTTNKPLYSIPILSSDYASIQCSYSNFLIDIESPLTFHDCTEEWKKYPIPCTEYQCQDVQTTYSNKNPSCDPITENPISPGWGYCSCPVNVVNPVTGSCDRSLLNYDFFTLNTSDGRTPINGIFSPTPTGACASSSSSSSFQSFPKDVTGVMTFSSSPYALPATLAKDNIFKKIIALCLPSNSSSSGVLFVGNDPYYLLPNSNVDIRSFLSYTPLIKYPDSFGYFIRINTIVIKKRSIDIPANATTKLSTVEPYTALRTDIYNQVVRRFSLVTKRLVSAKAAAPFGLCFSNLAVNGSKLGGLKVPDIDFGLQDGKKWAISTPNLIKQITNDVACLAFVDGGATSEPAIVIGTFQFEDNFLVFDLVNSTFGFSSSLLNKKTSCSNFNFTVTD